MTNEGLNNTMVNYVKIYFSRTGSDHDGMVICLESNWKEHYKRRENLATESSEAPR